MKADGIWFRKHACFEDWAGFEAIQPINLVIGRNNSGKSRLLEVLDVATGRNGLGCEVQMSVAPTEEELRDCFGENDRYSGLSGNAWFDHGRYLIGTKVTWDNVHNISLNPSSSYSWGVNNILPQLRKLVIRASSPLAGKNLRRLGAERDVVPEPANNSQLHGALGVDEKGSGATNLIRRYITGTSFPRDLVQVNLLQELNEILGEDAQFQEVVVRQHVPNKPHEGDDWEIFLKEEHKGLVSLSVSGSGIKTILLVLLNLIVVPHLEQKTEYVFCFEELENSLHPALFRRLLRYLEKYALQYGAIFFLTSHSAVALDVFAGSQCAQILRVQHDGRAARVSVVSHEFERHGALSELGAKASDLLQANGIIWVEGPSDAVYLNRWIELVSSGEFREGRDYQCAYFGGSLLGQMQARPADDAEEHLMNLLRLNANVVLITDSDRKSEQDSLKPRVERIKEQIEAIPRAVLWITEAREIENYLPAEALTDLEGGHASRAPDQFECFWPKESSSESYWADVVQRKAVDKVKLAREVTPHMTLENMSRLPDWRPKMDQIVAAIRRWNE